MDPLMQDAPLCGEEVLRPGLFDVNEGALPLAEQKMLQS
jgi:hypothetical protein